MRVIEAFEAILAILENRQHLAPPDWEGCSLEHLRSMLSRMQEAESGHAFSEGKRNRWLGYIQGVAVASGIMTLNECKDLNRSFIE